MRFLNVWAERLCSARFSIAYGEEKARFDQWHFPRKKRNLKKIMAFGDGRISGKTLENMKACGSFMEFIATVDKEKKKDGSWHVL